MSDSTYEREAVRSFNAALDSNHPEHGIKRALVGIGYALLHLASEVGRGVHDGDGR